MGNEKAMSAIDVVEQAQELWQRGNLNEAAGLLEKAVGQGQGGLLARLTLVRMRVARRDLNGAISLARTIALENTQVADAALALGEALAGGQSLPLAIAEFQRALRLDPHLEAARIGLAKAWLDAGEPERALDAMDQIGNCAELHERAMSMRARPRSDAGYVRHLFDQFSADYDQRMLATLSYAAPAILVHLAELVLPRKRDLEILDLGCGTGLCAEAFKKMASRICGIDLSPKMLAEAKRRGIYDMLIEGDQETAQATGSFDLAVAADSMVYLGDLSPVLRNVRTQLRQGGHFLFTVERGDQASYELGPKRRWQHSEAYLRCSAREQNFNVAGILECTPRTESGQPVCGFACALEKGHDPEAD